MGNTGKRDLDLRAATVWREFGILPRSHQMALALTFGASIVAGALLSSVAVFLVGSIGVTGWVMQSAARRQLRQLPDRTLPSSDDGAH